MNTLRVVALILGTACFADPPAEKNSPTAKELERQLVDAVLLDFGSLTVDAQAANIRDMERLAEECAYDPDVVFVLAPILETRDIQAALRLYRACARRDDWRLELREGALIMKQECLGEAMAKLMSSFAKHQSAEAAYLLAVGYAKQADRGQSRAYLLKALSLEDPSGHWAIESRKLLQEMKER